MTDRLVLGPLLRHVDETSATLWVETAEQATVTARMGDRSSSARTFAAHDHHYAIVDVEGLEPGTVAEYAIDIDGVRVWPPVDSEFPPSRIATLTPGKPLRLAFGSCRTSVPHDRDGNRRHGVDALHAYALRMASDEGRRWPDLLLFLGDQVYADETSDAMRDFIRQRRDISQPPGEELKDYEEYAHLYRLAWTDPANRWLLSTLPTSMIFDDHDVRDDWNTSLTWRKRQEAMSWWRDRIVGALASYWVYQHMGNLTPQARAKDPVWQRIVAAGERGEEADVTRDLDELAERADSDPSAYRWSYARDIGSVRLIVVDSRAARVLEPGRRSILDEEELSWLDDQLVGGFDHVLIGTSLPFLLAPGLHHLEGWNDAVAEGAWGRRWSRWGEKLREAVDFEHWAAFPEGFTRVAELVLEVADGSRGRAPGTITFLSGDVHNSYVAQADGQRGASHILQAVCSPIRNPLPKVIRYVTSGTASRLGRQLGRLAARTVKQDPPPFEWRLVRGPWYDNNLATLEVEGRGLRFQWETGVVRDGPEDRPELDLVAEVRIEPKD